MTLKDAIDAYLVHLREDRARAYRTRKTYEQELRLFSGGVGEKTRVKKLQRSHVIAHLERQVPGRALPGPSTRNRKLSVLRGFFEFLEEHARLRVNPTAGIRWARVPVDEQQCLDRVQYRALLQAVNGLGRPWLRARERAMIKLIYHTGVRVAELASLAVEQVDLDAAMLTRVRRKGGEDRNVPLNRTIIAELRRWMTVRASRHPATEQLFIGRAGRGLGVRQVERRVKALGEQADIPFPVTPHTLRHTYATELVHRGVNLEVVRRLMNHKSITTTSRYSHVGFDALREAVEQLSEEEA